MTGDPSWGGRRDVLAGACFCRMARFDGCACGVGPAPTAGRWLPFAAHGTHTGFGAAATRGAGLGQGSEPCRAWQLCLEVSARGVCRARRWRQCPAQGVSCGLLGNQEIMRCSFFCGAFCNDLDGARPQRLPPPQPYSRTCAIFFAYNACALCVRAACGLAANEACTGRSVRQAPTVPMPRRQSPWQGSFRVQRQSHIETMSSIIIGLVL